MSRWPNVTWPDWLDMDPAPDRPAVVGAPDRNGSRRDGSAALPVATTALDAPKLGPADSEPIDVVARPRPARPVAPPVAAVPDAPAAVRARLLSIVPAGWSPASDHGDHNGNGRGPDNGNGHGPGHGNGAAPHRPAEPSTVRLVTPAAADLAGADTAVKAAAVGLAVPPVVKQVVARPRTDDAPRVLAMGPVVETRTLEVVGERESPSEEAAAEPVATTPPAPPVEESNLPPAEAPTVLSVRQRVVLIAAAVVVVIGLVAFTVPTLVTVMAALVVFFIAANVMKLWLISRALNEPHAMSVDPVGDRIPDEFLPIYTILLPVFHEAGMLPQLVDGILSLDYPEDRLDVKLLLEEEDTETRQAAGTMDLPACFDVLVVPDVGPTGKPRACNYGLAHARGAYLVIYDAEDRPERDQLRKSVAAFWAASRDVVCFQAQLNYFNRTYNLLTRWFTAEYSVWFDQLLPGLQAVDVVIPLGGTSNHFITSRLRLIGGWNSYNVTEDADLGVRIHLQGWKTAILETTTYEEATSRYRNWIRQRSRWVKGYMQTYLFHMRQPVRLARRMGAKSYSAFQLFFGAGTLCLLLNPLFWLLAVLWFVTKLHLIQSIFPWPVLYLGTIGLFVGNAACVLSVMSGCFARRNYEDVKYALLIPVYWVLMSIGAWKALVQLFTKPSYWEKTEHGFCLFEDENQAAASGPGELTLADLQSAS